MDARQFIAVFTDKKTGRERKVIVWGEGPTYSHQFDDASDKAYSYIRHNEWFSKVLDG